MLAFYLGAFIATLNASPTTAPAKLDGLYALQVQTAPECELTISVNREVAVHVQSAGSGILDVTNFVINGKNTIKLVASGAAAETSATLFRMRGPTDPQPVELLTFKLALTDEKRLQEAEQTFEAGVPFAWLWQDGTKLSGLSEDDKKEVYAELQRATDALTAGDWSKAASLRAAWITKKAGALIPREWVPRGTLEQLIKQEKELFGRVRSSRLAPPSELRFLVGERLVRIETAASRGPMDPPEANVIWAQLAPECDPVKGAAPAFGDKVIYVTRVGGRWRVLAGNWISALAQYPE